MARFIELIDNHNIKHAIRVATIEQIYELGVKGNENVYLSNTRQNNCAGPI